MKLNLCFVSIIFIMFFFVESFAQEIPYVYELEHTGAECAAPILPSMSELSVIEPLTDPFEWSDGSGRDTRFENWFCRRSEIRNEIEHYEIGLKPKRPDTITASYSDGALTVNVTKNGKTLTLSSNVNLPDGEGPFPAIIGMAFFPGGAGTGSLPSDIFTSRNIARIEFVHDQVTSYGNQNDSDPYYQLYPELNATNTGQYSAWAWGVSRLIDGLELVQDSLPIDIKHLAVTGCSYAGKMSLFAGAFDERIALTIAQESGGGGAPAWRVSETIGNVERLGSTDHNWFKESMFKFANSNVQKLPHDHHELMAMCAPRALLVTANTDFEWLANPSCYVSARATQRVYETFGIEDRFGFFIDGGHGHCSIPNSQKPAIEAFVERFLLGDTTVSTDVSTHPYDYIDYSRWTKWWGTGNPEFPSQDSVALVEIYLEPECGIVGSNWYIIEEQEASNNNYVTVNPDIESVDAAPTSADDYITITFNVDTSASYNLYARANCPSGDDDSFWIQMDDGSFVNNNNLGTSGWEWVRLAGSILDEGEHTITIAYRENGALLDKICLSTGTNLPVALGKEAENKCEVTDIEDQSSLPENFGLEQNYPNPFNPTAQISYHIPYYCHVSLKVYDVLGKEVANLVNAYQNSGKYSVTFNAENLAGGVYFYSINSGNYTNTKKLVLLK